MRWHKPFADGRGAALAAMLALAGCGAVQQTGAGGDPRPNLAPATPDLCGAGRLAGFAGLPVAELDEQYLPQVVRVIRPGDAVTEDFSAARLNVDLDAGGRMVRFWCG